MVVLIYLPVCPHPAHRIHADTCSTRNITGTVSGTFLGNMEAGSLLVLQQRLEEPENRNSERCRLITSRTPRPPTCHNRRFSAAEPIRKSTSTTTAIAQQDLFHTPETTMATSALSIASAFGLPVGMKDFDFSKMTTVKKEQEGLKFALAPSFGTLTTDSVKTMDEKLKVIISGTTRLVARLKDKSWSNVVAALSQNSLLEPMPGSDVKRADKFIKDKGTSAFKFD